MTGLATTTPPAPAVVTERWPAPVAAAATVVAAALVLYHLGEKSFWFDEAFSVGIVDRPVGDALWRMAHWEVNQSPFYLVLAGWWRLGQGEAFLRLAAAASTVAAVPALYVLGRRIADARVGAVAALLLAMHPLSIQWGQQLRGYSLALLLVVLATTMLLRAVDAPHDTPRALAYAAVAAVATYAHFFAGLVIASHALWILLLRPVPRRLVVSAGAAYAALVAPLGWFLVTREGDPLDWVSDRVGSAVVEAATGLTGGTRWSVLAYAVGGAAGLWSAVRAIRATRPAAAEARWRPLLPVVWLAAPVLAVAVSTATVKPLLEARFLIVVVPALALLAAMGACWLGARSGAVLVVALVATSAIGLDSWYSTPSHQDWRGATRLVAAAAGADGPILVEPWGGIFAVRYYEDRYDLGHHRVLEWRDGEPPEDDRLVEVQTRTSAGEMAPMDPSYVAWRDEHFVLQAEEHTPGVVVRTYQRG